MIILVYDTETTGLPKSKHINIDTLHLWPYIVQFSYILYDTEKHDVLKIKDYIIKLPEHIKISDESINIHGITNEISQVNGCYLRPVLEEFMIYYHTADKIVCHNAMFDLNMVKVELMRIIENNKEDKFTLFLNNITSVNNVYCTMMESIKFCNIKALNKIGNVYIKYPKLSELHYKLFQDCPKNLHNSLNDVIVCLRCFYKLNTGQDILTKNEIIKILFQELLL
jgi:DNA polymerase III epsilon subunit-like protein